MGLSILFNYILPLESRFCNISYYFVVGTLQRGLKKKKEGKNLTPQTKLRWTRFPTFL